VSGWDEKRRVPLEPPWDSFYVELWEDPPMGTWLALQEAAAAALANPGDLEAIERAIASFGPLVAAHNLTDRAGKPIGLTLREMSGGLFLAVLLAVKRALEGAGTAVPLGNRANSPAASSRAPRRRCASSSGSSPAT
jgi:hypothetical protein